MPMLWTGLVRILVLLGAVLLVSACNDPNAKAIAQLDTAIKDRFAKVEQDLGEGRLPNAKILARYVAQAKTLEPDYADVMDGLGTMAGPQNRRFQDLKVQHKEVMKAYDKRSVPSGQIAEQLQRIYDAAAPERINAGLVDEINTVAALTNGALSPINLPDGGALPEAGTALVGNPSYGSWQQQSNGTPMWVWFAQYALLQSVVGNMFYPSWYYNRPWSYDYDVYRDRFGTPRWRNREAGRMSRNWPSIEREGQRRGRKPSAYARRTNRSVQDSAASRRHASFGETRAQIARNGGRRPSAYQTRTVNTSGSARRVSSYGSGNRYPASRRSAGSSRSFRGK
ncbi:MAG: hypothetical protein ACFB6R_01675 [Alphaproteobacteria bacterium]